MFWLVVAGLVVLVSVPMVRTLTRGQSATVSAAEQDIAIYKDQLVELEHDVTRGVVTQDEAKAAHTEIARRLLTADKRVQAELVTKPAPKGLNVAVFGVVALALTGAIGLYTLLGTPNLPDMPLQSRLEAAQQARDARPNQLVAEEAAPKLNVEADPDHETLVAQLRAAVAQNPGDPTGLRLLVDNEARLGNLSAARAAQEQLMVVLGDAAMPDDFTDTGEIMILAAGGYVSPQAEAALVQALNQDPRNPRARYYSGLSLAQTGRPDVAYRMWSGLLEEGPADAPWMPLIQSQIGQVARAAGIPLTTQPISGPSADDIESAEQLSSEERQDMIRGMVGGLANRLATDGGTPAEWARLIRAYGVLGERGKANAIWKEAQETFKSDANAMVLLTEAARAAEIIN